MATRLTLLATEALRVIIAALGNTNPAKEDELNLASLAVPLIPTPSLQSLVTWVNTFSRAIGFDTKSS